MSINNHERARHLLRADRVEGISDSDRQWLDSHLFDCESCMKEASAVSAAIEAWRAVSVVAPADLVYRTTLAVRHQAEQHQAEHEPKAFLGIAVAISSVLAIVTTPYTLAAFAWIGRFFNVTDVVWQLAFVMWWFLPATVLSAAAGWKHVARRQS